MKRVKNKPKDIIFLLILLLSISCSIALIHGENQKLQNDREPTNAEVLNALSPQLISGDVVRVARAISQLPLEQQKEVMRKILKNPKSPFTRDEKLNLIFKLALQNPNESDRHAILSLFSDNLFLLEGKGPLFYLAARNNNEKIIPALRSGIKNLSKKNPKIKLSKLIIDSLEYAISQNDPDALQKMFEQGIMITPALARRLLWQAVEQNSSPEFVSLLKKQGAALNDVKNKRTPLIKAVENHNFELVKKLIQEGADINLIPDVEVGSALQAAVRKQLTEIDVYLREHGARE